MGQEPRDRLKEKRGVTAETAMDILAAAGLAMLASGVYLEFGLGRALIVAGGAVIATVVAAIFRR